MSDSVENRVVEMRFDNQDFETHAAQSIKTLDELDKALEFKNSSKGFEDIQNGMSRLDFSGLHDSISSIDNAFTSLAGSIERNFLDRISNGLLNFGENLWNNTIGQITSGGKQRALNIEQAKFKIKGLGKEWQDVADDIDYAVSGTAYGLDAAASASAQFLASGVKEGKDMKAALRAISGVAAMTSSDYESISRVFTAAAGKGRVQAIELNRLSLRGINAAAALAKYMNVTESEVREMSRKGLIDFQTFANAMDSAFGEHAKKANETFTGSLSNIKAALSRIGEIFYEPWLKNMIPVNNAIRESLNKIITVLKAEVYPLGGKMKSFKDLIADLNKMVSRLVQEFIKSLNPFIDRLPYRLERVMNAGKSLRHHLKEGVNTFKTLNNMLENPWDFAATVDKRLLKSNKNIKKEEWKLAREMVKAKQYNADYEIQADEKQMKLIKEKGLSLEHVQSIVDTLTSKEQKYLDGITQKEINYAQKIYNSGDYNSKKGIIYSEEAKAEMQELGLDAQRVQRYLDALTNGQNKDVERNFGHEKAAKVLLYLYNEGIKLERLFGIMWDKIKKVGKAISEAFHEIQESYHPVAIAIPSIVDFLTTVVKRFTIAGDRFNYIKDIAKGAFSIIELLWYGVKNLFKYISEGTSELGEAQPFILKFFATFGRFFTALAEAIIHGKEMPSILETFKEAFGGLWDSVKKLVGEGGSVRTFFTKAATWISDAFSKIIKCAKEIFGLGNKKGEKSGPGAILDMIISIFKPKDATLEKAGEGIQKFASKIGDIFLSLLEFAKHITDNLGEVFDWIWGILQGQGENISKLLDALFNFFTKMLNGELKFEMFEALKDVVIAMADALKTIFETIKEVVLAIKEPVVTICKSIAEIVATFSESINNVLKWIGADPEAAYGAAAFFAIIDLIAKGLTSSKRKKGLTQLRELPTTIKEFFGTLSQSIRLAVTGTPVDQLKKFASALLMMSLACFIMMGAFTNMYGMGFNSEGDHSNEVNTKAVIETLTGLATFMGTMIFMLIYLGKLSTKTADIHVGFLTALISFMSSAILKIALAFAVIGLVTKVIGAENAKVAATMIIGIIALFMVTVFIVMNALDKLQGGDSKGFGKSLKGVGTIIAMMGLAISLISGAFIKMMIAVAGLTLLTGDSNEAMKIMLGIFAIMMAFIGAFVLSIVVIADVAQKLSAVNIKSLLGVAAVLFVMGIFVKQVTSAMLGMAAFLVVSDNLTALAIAFGMMAALLLILIGLIGVVGKIGSTGGGTDILKASLGIAAIVLTLTGLIQQVAMMAIMFKAANITVEDLKPIIAIIAILGVLIASLALIAVGSGGVGTGFLLGIAVAVLAIAAAIKLMASAMWIVIKSFIALSLVYPTIKDIIPDMMTDMREKLPEFIKIVGEAFRALLIEIMQSAPLIAAVIVEVAVLVATLTAQKAPIIVGAWLLMIDEVVTLLLIGSAVILPKLLALALIFLGYLEANAAMLGEKLTGIVLKAIWGAIIAIDKFFSDYIPKWVDENFDRLNQGILANVSTNSKLYNALGDLFYKLMNGQGVDEDIADLAGDYMVVDQVTGKLVWKNQNGHTIRPADVAAMQKQAKEEAAAAVEEIEKATEDEAEIQINTDVSSNELKDYIKDMDVADEISKDMDDAAVARAESIKKEKEKNIKSEGDAGVQAANKYTDNYNTTIANSDMSSGLLGKLGEMIGLSGDKGTEAGNAFGNNFMSSLSGFDMSSLMGDFSADGLTANAMGNLQNYSADNLANGIYSDYQFDTDQYGFAAPMTDGQMSVLGNNQTNSGALGVDALTGRDDSNTMNMLSQLKNLIKSIGDKVENTIVIPEGCTIDITTTIDKQVLGKTMTPVVNTINNRNDLQANRKMAGQVP